MVRRRHRAEGDEVRLRAAQRPRGASPALRLLGVGQPAAAPRSGSGSSSRSAGHRDVDGMIAQHAALARALARAARPADAVARRARRGLRALGRQGLARRARRRARSRSRRGSSQLAEFVEVAHRDRRRRGGARARARAARRRSSTRRSPTLLVRDADEIFDGLDDVGALGRRRSTPSPRSRSCCRASGSTRRSTAIADFVDLKSPYTLGHSARRRRPGRPPRAPTRPRRPTRSRRCGAPGWSTTSAGSACPTRSGTSRGRSAPARRERVRLQPVLTERMLRQSDAAGAARRDRGAAPRAPRRLRLPARLSRRRDLRARRACSRAADAYQAMREPRPHRPARSADEAAASCAPRSAPGGSTPTPSTPCSPPPATASRGGADGPAGLTAREVEVLRLLARGLSNKQIAERLVISPKTVGNHIEHIYTKIGASNRAAASLFAMQHGLLPEEEFPVAPPPDGSAGLHRLHVLHDDLLVCASSSVGLNWRNSVPGSL